jgi:hypothetical protein
MSLVPVQRAILHELVLENPLGGPSHRRPRDKVPHAVGQQGLVLLRSAMPIGIGEHATDRGWDRRQRQGSGGDDIELQTVHEFGDPDSAMGDYQVGSCGCHEPRWRGGRMVARHVCRATRTTRGR